MSPATSGLTSEGEEVHLGVCNFCGVNCYYQDCPTGGWWVHEWPTKEVEAWTKKHHPHDANPGWDPVIPEEDS